MNQTYLTPEGAAKLKNELKELTTTRRTELAARLRDAIKMGDLSENADYIMAKEEQAFLEGRIMELETVLRNAQIIAEAETDFVSIGNRVTVQEPDYDPETFILVGAKESDPGAGKISNESPIGRALLGRRVGDVVVAQTPNGKIQFKILSIE